VPPSDRPELPKLPVTFRPIRTRVILLTVGAALLTVLTVIAMLLPAASAAERAGFVLTGLAFFGVLLLLSRPRVVAETDGVTVINLTTTRRLAWAQVLRVNLRPGDPWVHLDLADGTSLPVMGIQLGVAKAQAIADARTLRALAETYGTSTSAA
jgi:hypothetical protein